MAKKHADETSEAEQFAAQFVSPQERVKALDAMVASLEARVTALETAAARPAVKLDAGPKQPKELAKDPGTRE